MATAPFPYRGCGTQAEQGDQGQVQDRPGGVTVVNDAGATLDVVPVQIAARWEDLQDAGLAGVPDRHNPVWRGATGAFDHRGALGEGGAALIWRWLIVPRATPVLRS